MSVLDDERWQTVWLQNRASGGYLLADEDGLGVSIHPSRASRNAAWGRESVEDSFGGLLRLQGVAYGRYLASTEAPADARHVGFRVVQINYDGPEEKIITWRFYQLAPGIVLIFNSRSGSLFPGYLRANGDIFHWETGVTVHETTDNGVDQRMHWLVLPIHSRITIPPLPYPNHNLETLMCRRQIRYAPMGSDWRANDSAWQVFEFYGTSVSELMTELQLRSVNFMDSVQFHMCVRAGQMANLTLLLVNLPTSCDPITIVILSTRSPILPTLRLPDVDYVD